MRIKEAFNTALTDGSIFKYLPLYGGATAPQMAIAYVLRHSGEKTASSLVQNYTDENGHLTTEGQQMIGNILKLVFKDSWDKKWEALTENYNPIENYDRKEDSTIDFTKGQQQNSQTIGSQTNSQTIGQQSNSQTIGSQSNSQTIGQQSTTDNIGERNSSQTNSIQGFNSNSYQPDSKTDTNNSAATDISTQSGRSDSETIGERNDSETIGSRNDSQTIGARTDNETEGIREDTTTTTSRIHGNIGVTTTQQMILSELELRSLVNNFFEMMFKDIDSYCALKVYGDYDWFDKSSKESGPNIEIDLIQRPTGVTIKVIQDGDIQTANINDGKTPQFKIENGDLYVKYDN